MRDLRYLLGKIDGCDALRTEREGETMNGSKPHHSTFFWQSALMTTLADVHWAFSAVWQFGFQWKGEGYSTLMGKETCMMMLIRNDLLAVPNKGANRAVPSALGEYKCRHVLVGSMGLSCSRIMRRLSRRVQTAMGIAIAPTYTPMLFTRFGTEHKVGITVACAFPGVYDLGMRWNSLYRMGQDRDRQKTI